MKKTVVTLEDKTYTIEENDKLKILHSPEHNFIFSKYNGMHMRWGKDKQHDPDWGLPEIADIEISEVCHGVGGLCKFCYKSNTPKGSNMSLETFRKVFTNLPPSITQIAFGIGDINGNPELFDIIRFTRENGVIPNITINGSQLTEEIATFFSEQLGAIAVSYYDKDTTYNAIELLTSKGMSQVNIHYVIKQDRLQEAYNLINDMQNDPRLSKMNAVVWLSLKPKGRAKDNFDPLTKEEFTALMNKCFESNIRFGMDSCSAMKFLEYSNENIKDEKLLKQINTFVEPCEATCFSMYINVEGKFFPCSFLEDEDYEGIDCTQEDFNFLESVWMNDKTKEIRNKITNCKTCGKSCYKYDI